MPATTAKIDLSGRTFGKLKVLRLAVNIRRKTRQAVWRCLCSCGRKVFVTGGDLRNGKSQSCRFCATVAMVIDLSGQRFGKLVVLRRVPLREKGQKDIYWVCRCDCGHTKRAQGHSLRNGTSRSCGCSREDLAHDLTGQRFGKLVATERIVGVVKNWRCKCDCGQVVDVSAGDLVGSKKTHCGCVRSLVGQRFGKLKVVGRADSNIRGQRLWNCNCDCGGSKITTTAKLREGSCRSCGCLARGRKRTGAGQFISGPAHTSEEATAQTDVHGRNVKPPNPKHLKWREWKTSGMSWGEVRDKWEYESGEVLTREAIIFGVKRLPPDA
jgi:hypothetical protein